MREEVLRTYKNDLPERLPLSRQKEFKRIKNIVIEEAVRLSQEVAVLSPADDEAEAPASSENIPPPAPPEESMPENDTPEVRNEVPPTVQWSKRYKQARQFLFGDSKTPPDFEQAYTLLLEEAHAGNALAMHDLGRMFADGIGRDADASQAQAWYAKALSAFQTVEKGQPTSYVEYRIGKMFAAGLGCDHDYESAARWFTKSAEQGNIYAQYSLAGLYSEGQGVEQNYKKAIQLYAQSAAKGFPYAAWELGKLYRDGVGCRPDVRQAAHYFASAFRGFKVLESQSHDDKLQYRIGWMLLHGAGAEQDETAARTWFQRSAQAGNQNAQYQLAKLILSDARSGP